MTHDQAVELIAVLASYFRQEISDETAMLWARELAHFEIEDGLEAAELAGKALRFMPSLKEFCDLIADCRRHRTPALAEAQGWGIGFGEWYAMQDGAMKARVHRVFPSLSAKLGVDLEAL